MASQLLRLLRVSEDQLASLIQTILADANENNLLQNICILQDILSSENHSEAWLQELSDLIFSKFCAPLLVKLHSFPVGTTAEMLASLIKLVQMCLHKSTHCRSLVLRICKESLCRSTSKVFLSDRQVIQSYHMPQEHLKEDLIEIEADVAVQLVCTFVSAVREVKSSEFFAGIANSEQLEELYYMLLKLLKLEESNQILVHNSLAAIKGIISVHVKLRDALIKVCVHFLQNFMSIFCLFFAMAITISFCMHACRCGLQTLLLIDASLHHVLVICFC